MPDLPLMPSTDIPSFDILINGRKIKDVYQVISVEVERTVFRIPTAKIILALPGGDGNQSFAASESDDFIPGVEIEIKLGYNSNAETVFRGIIVNHGIRNLGDEINDLILHCSDLSAKMTFGRKSAYYQDMKDSAIMGSMLGDYGLSNEVEATTYIHKQLIKYQESDWDFIVGRAEANGMLAYAENGKVSVKKPLSSGMADLKVTFGVDVLSYDFSLEARFQAPSVTNSAWDFKTQSLVEGKSSEPNLSKLGNLKGIELGEKIGLSAIRNATTIPMEENELKAWADAQLTHQRISMMQGTITFAGSAKPNLNTLLEIDGFGDRFNGNALITNIQHTLREGLWQTTVGFGLPPEKHFEQRAVSAPSSVGLLPAIHGLQNGIVKKIDADPDGQYRIQVDVPGIAPSCAGLWARMAHFYASSGKGSFFLP